jgi:glycoprotein-N-acetylgalactosamine 3-beta-galactosyltransferase
MVASNVTVPSLNTVNIPHWGEENYNGVWQKLRSIWAYIYSNYINEYDFFYLGGDDYYLIVENLRYYVSSNEIVSNAGGPGWPKPLYLGRRVLDRHELNQVLNHGGPGYTLNRAALKLLVEKAFMRDFCEPYRWKHSEDRFLGECFRGVSVEPYNTRDQKLLHRFHIFTPYQIATGTWGGLGKWVHKYVCFDDGQKSCSYGWDSVSEESISFHYVQPHLMKQIHAALYSMCEFRQGEEAEQLRQLMNKSTVTA